MPDIKLHLTIKSVYSLQKTFFYLSWLNSTVVGTMLALATKPIGLSIVCAEMFGCLLSIALPLNVSCNYYYYFFNAERSRVAVLWILSVSLIKKAQSWQERAAAI